MVIDDVGLYGPLVPKTKGKCVIFQKNPHLCIYLLTTSLTVATKMILQILSDSGILRVAWNTVDPCTLPASHHIFFRSNGIIKCDRNIKYSRAALGFKFWNSRGLWRPIFCQFHLRSRASIEIFVLDIHNIFYWVNSYLYDESRRYLISNTAPDLATWRPWQFAFKWPLIFGCSSALFCALLPIFLLSFDLNLPFFRCSWLLVALWRV